MIGNTRHGARGVLAVLPTLLLAASAIAAPKAGAWREVFQSSPAAYDPVSPTFFDQVAKQFKVPVKVIEASVTPRQVTGTSRFRFTVTGGGSQVRVRLSNEEGKAPLLVSSATLGAAAKGFEAEPKSLRRLTFDGRPGVMVPAGALLLSDPVDLSTTAGNSLVASLFLSNDLELDPRGGGAVSVAAGDQTLSDAMTGAKPIAWRPLITGAEVFAADPPKVIVAFGDSITDGNRMSATALQGWPARLAQRLTEHRAGPRYAVVNGGIGGNRLLAGGWGPAALARFDRDVLRIEGISHVIILEGTNDIGMSGKSLFGKNPSVSARDIASAYRQMIARAHSRGVKVVIGTILPFGASPSHYSIEKEQVRLAVNQWIRTSRLADAFIDFDLGARDPANPVNMRKEFGSPDGLHPGDTGYMATGDAIDLTVFK